MKREKRTSLGTVADELEDEAIRFAAARGWCEFALGETVALDPEPAILACNSVNLEPVHFQVHRSARIIFIAGRLAHQYGRTRVLRLAWRGLKAEQEDAAAEELIELGKAKPGSPYIAYFVALWLAEALVKFSVDERDAMEHYVHALTILKKRGAA